MKSLLRLILAASLMILPVLAVSAQDTAAPVAAPAAEVTTPAPVNPINSGDTAWILTSAALVLLMTIPGLALFYGGMVRRKNILSAMYYSMGAAVIVSVIWVIVQYSMAFSTWPAGPDGTVPWINFIIGDFSKVLMHGVTVTSPVFTIPEFAFSTFQLMFAIITVALISGSVVERMSIKAWFIFTAIWSLIVYAPLAHMVWGGGWLSDMANGIGKFLGVLAPGANGAFANALDFAGGTVVHISSGVSALVLALVLGPRVRFGKDPIIPNNVVYTFVGAGLLWVGWFGFNGGSALGANGLAASAFLATNTAAAAAGAVWIIIELFHHGKPSLIGVSTGVVAGLVGITPAAGFVDIGGALVIGATVAIASYIFVVFVKKALKYDDSLDAFGVHAVGGTVGAILTGIFATAGLGFYFDGVTPALGAVAGNPGQIIVQVVAVLVAYLFAIVGTLIAVGITSLITPLRVEPQEEVNGLDITQHGEKVL